MSTDAARVELYDVEACIRLIDGMSLPLEMQPFRNGLLERLRNAIEAGNPYNDATPLGFTGDLMEEIKQ